MRKHTNHIFFSFLVALMLPGLTSCKRKSIASTAFYYWKAEFKLTANQQKILQLTAGNKLYVRFFDVDWNDQKGRPYPNALIHFSKSTKQLNIIPVIYIRNKIFENLNVKATDSLASHCNSLIAHISADQHLNYGVLQVDCDWTLTTKDKYFNFLRSLKKASRCRLEATVRLHQIKYKQQTGVPPVDQSVLMFYNMGKLSPGLLQASSIYNWRDAAKYISYLKTYPLPVDVALPVFSWSIHIRNGKIIQIYGQVDKSLLQNKDNFQLILNHNVYRSNRSFFLKGIYIKQNDIFKLEETTAETLNEAAKQLADYLPEQPNRTIIYYELANLNSSEFKAETFRKISARF